jgi:hypothetical protein
MHSYILVGAAIDRARRHYPATGESMRHIKPSLLSISAILALALAPACGSGSGTDGDGGNGAIDGSTTDIDAGDGICVGLNGQCESTFECCGDRTCEEDGNGDKRCANTSFCTAAGQACNQASECCSLSCDGTCKDDGSLCKPVDTDCGSNSECCSNICDVTCQSIGGACSPVGEVCTSEGVDGDCCSLHCENFGTSGDPDFRCARASSCGARGEICVTGADCCSGVCDGGRCPTQSDIGGQRFAGEPCLKDSDCASYACASEYVGGPKVCQFLGGCRPAGEICSESWQCCSDVHLEDGAPGEFCTLQGEGTGCVEHGGVEGLSICDLQTGPKEVGEICRDTEGNNVHQCCPPEDEDACQQTITGVWRCAGPGGIGECLPDGEPCLTADQCCSQICIPVETEDGTELRCGPCVPDGGACTTSADCCNYNCTDGVCQEDNPECVPLGASCETNDDCCSGYCSADTGTCGTIQID